MIRTWECGAEDAILDGQTGLWFARTMCGLTRPALPLSDRQLARGLGDAGRAGGRLSGSNAERSRPCTETSSDPPPSEAGRTRRSHGGATPLRPVPATALFSSPSGGDLVTNAVRDKALIGELMKMDPILDRGGIARTGRATGAKRGGAWLSRGRAHGDRVGCRAAVVELDLGLPNRPPGRAFSRPASCTS